jgi:hypothetical protein
MKVSGQLHGHGPYSWEMPVTIGWKAVLALECASALGREDYQKASSIKIRIIVRNCECVNNEKPDIERSEEYI